MDAAQRPGHLGAAQPLQKGTAICLGPLDAKQPEAPILGDRGAPLSLPPYQLKARAWGRSSSTSETRSHNTDHHHETGACTLCLCSCVFPHYCPPGSVHPRSCPGGSEALNGSGLRVSQETCCRLCEAGTYHSWALDTLPCQPCPAGFSCHQGESGKPGAGLGPRVRTGLSLAGWTEVAGGEAGRTLGVCGGQACSSDPRRTQVKEDWEQGGVTSVLILDEDL